MAYDNHSASISTEEKYLFAVSQKKINSDLGIINEIICSIFFVSLEFAFLTVCTTLVGFSDGYRCTEMYHNTFFEAVFRKLFQFARTNGEKVQTVRKTLFYFVSAAMEISRWICFGKENNNSIENIAGNANRLLVISFYR